MTGLLALIGSLLCFLFLQFDLWSAVYGIPNRALLVSLFASWIGYPIVFVYCILYRIYIVGKETNRDEYASRFPESLSLLKDVFYGLLDAWSKGIFALWTAYTVFGMSLFGSPPAHPHVWAAAAAAAAR